MKRTLRILMAIVLLLLIAATSIVVYFLRVTGDEGSSDLEKWIGRQLREVAGAYLNVELAFDNPDYQYPSTIVVEDIRLTAPDPANPGKSIDIIRIGKATLTVAQVPREGQPLHIERVVLEQPEFSFICTSADDATLVGFSNIVKTSGDQQQEQEQPDSARPPARITDVFRIRLVHLINGKVHYDPRDPDERVMMLDRINLVLNVEPDQQGWYKLNTRMDRAPIGELNIHGRFNLDDNTAQLDDLSLAIHLGGDNNRSLPPQMQRALADHDLRGHLSAGAKGSIRFDDWINANIDLDVSLKDGNVAFGDYRLSLPEVSLSAAMADRRVEVRKLAARLLDGTLTGNGQLGLEPPYNADARLRGDLLRIHKVLKAAPAVDAAATTTQELPFRGVASFQVAARAPLTDIKSRLNGGGHVTVREGRFINVGFLNRFEDGLAGITGSGARKSRMPGANDSLHILFNFKNDRTRFERIDYRSTLVAARGQGEMLHEGLMLNLMVNGGPIEKLQTILGPVGDLTALVTDRVAKYRVIGPVGNPKVDAIIAEGIFDNLFKRR